MHPTPDAHSTSSSSAQARPGSPPPGTCGAATCGTSSSTPPPSSVTPGAPAGTRCGCSPRRSTTGCPGWPFPAPADSYPTKDEVADYLAAYAARFELPVLLDCAVTRLERATAGYVVAHHPGHAAPPTRSWSPPGRSRPRSSPARRRARPRRGPAAQRGVPQPRPAPGRAGGRGRRRELRAARSPTSSPPPTRSRSRSAPSRSSCRSGCSAATCSGG